MNALLARFLWNYHDTTRRWAAWALQETSPWCEMSDDERRGRAVEILRTPQFGPHDPTTGTEDGM